VTRRSLAALLFLVVLASGCQARTYVALFGDSVPAQAAPNIRNRLTPEHRLLLDATERAIIDDKLPDIRAAGSSADPPDVALVVLGAGDANDRHGDARMRRNIRQALDALRAVPCVRWLSLKIAGVNGYYRGYIDRADDFNRILAAEITDYPNARIAPYREWALQHGGSFKADGLHLTAAGKTRYAAFLEGVVDNPRCS
jgi:hypothetical protein